MFLGSRLIRDIVLVKKLCLQIVERGFLCSNVRQLCDLNNDLNKARMISETKILKRISCSCR